MGLESVRLQDDAQKLLDAHSKKRGDKTKIINEALRIYLKPVAAMPKGKVEVKLIG